MEPDVNGTRPAGHQPQRVPLSGWEAFFNTEFARVPVVVILRGASPDEAVAAARRAWESGVRLVEVTLESDSGLPALEAVVDAAPDGLPVGAGTVDTPEQLARAADAGARFGVAPGLNPETVRAAERHGVPFLPGVATPSEAGDALRMGLTTVKAFPASSLGPEWVRALAGPYPRLGMVATGGVTTETAPAFLRAGAVGVGMGRSVTEQGGLDALVREIAPG